MRVKLGEEKEGEGEQKQLLVPVEEEDRRQRLSRVPTSSPTDVTRQNEQDESHRRNRLFISKDLEDRHREEGEEKERPIRCTSLPTTEPTDKVQVTGRTSTSSPARAS